jgi:hypothetical protein
VSPKLHFSSEINPTSFCCLLTEHLVPKLSIKSKPTIYCRVFGVIEVSNKNLIIGTAIVLVLVVSAGFLVEVYLAIESINPTAAIAAITVALIGVVWMKKTKSTF